MKIRFGQGFRRLPQADSRRAIYLLLGVLGLISTFQNCSGLTGGSASAGSENLLSASQLNLVPVATTVAPQGTLQFTASGGDTSTYRFSVIGTGSIDQISGAYTAASASNDDIVSVTDSSGSAAYSFVKVATAGSPVALTPVALLIGFQSSYRFIATGGTAPFTYTVSPANFGNIDSSSGIFTAANSAGSVTVTATDSTGLTASSLVTIQNAAPTLAPIFTPNPLSFGQVATFYLSNSVGASLSLQSGPGSTLGMTYSPGYQVGPANLLMTVGNSQFPIQVPLNFINANLACTHGKKIFNYTGADQTFTPPANCPSIAVKMWGGAGAGCHGNYGGGGGFSTGTLNATETQPIPTLTVIVGGGGTEIFGEAYYNGSTVTSSNAYGGGGVQTGGGRSAIRAADVELMTAGGGGGGYYELAQFYNAGVMATGVGGAGGGSEGEPGSVILYELGVPYTGINQTVYNGGGGTQTAGGTSAVANTGGAGSQFRGGDAYWTAGSGGGGYYGGGAGGGYYIPLSIGYIIDNNDDKGGGGGGSGYIGGEGITNGQMIGGHGYTPGNTSDPDYIPGIAVGSGASLNDNYVSGSSDVGCPVGGNGLVVISW